MVMEVHLEMENNESNNEELPENANFVVKQEQTNDAPIQEDIEESQIPVDVEHLIDEVHSRPGLWCRYSPEFRSKEATGNAWLEVANAVHPLFDQLDWRSRVEFIKYLKKKWQNIKDYYRTCVLNHKRSKSGDNSKTRKQYVYGDKLKFLNYLFYAEAKDDIEQCSGQDSLDEESSTLDMDVASPPKQHKEDIQHSLCVCDKMETDPDLVFMLSFVEDMRKMKTSESLDFRIEVLKLVKRVLNCGNAINGHDT